jgi:hypothetical protein
MRMTSLGTHLVNNGRLSFLSRCKGKDVSDLEWVSYSWSYLMYLHTLVQLGMVIREIFALACDFDCEEFRMLP